LREEPYADTRVERSLSPVSPRSKSDGEGFSDQENNSNQTAIYIGNLTWWTTDQDLETTFSEFGKIKNIKFFEDKVNGRSKGYALVEYVNPDSANQAREKLNGREIHGKTCVINFVNPENLKQLNRVTSSASSGPSSRGSRGERRGGSSDRGSREGYRGGYKGRMPSNFGGNPLEMMARSGFFRGRGVGIPDPRMLAMPMAHVNPAFIPKDREGEYRERSRDDYYREREREEREREERYRKRDREREESRHKEEHKRSRSREREERKRHKEHSSRDRKH